MIQAQLSLLGKIFNSDKSKNGWTQTTHPWPVEPTATDWVWAPKNYVYPRVLMVSTALCVLHKRERASWEGFLSEQKSLHAAGTERSFWVINSAVLHSNQP